MSGNDAFSHRRDDRLVDAGRCRVLRLHRVLLLRQALPLSSLFPAGIAEMIPAGKQSHTKPNNTTLDINNSIDMFAQHERSRETRSLPRRDRAIATTSI
nr:hypothetical protein SHINE37_110291 [Rhizobiaceae bacterium]